jgi:hypothetical protein
VKIMTDERAEYLASASGTPPDEGGRLDSIRNVLGDEATWSNPPPHVVERVITEIDSARAASEPVGSRWGWIAAAAAIILILATAGLAGVFSTEAELTVAIAGTELEPQASGLASIREADAGWWIRLQLEDLPAASRGTYYEGWVWNDSGEGVSIGTFHLRGGEPAIELWSGVDPVEYPAIWVTLEDEDGDPRASDRVVMRGGPGDS